MKDVDTNSLKSNKGSNEASQMTMNKDSEKIINAKVNNDVGKGNTNGVNVSVIKNGNIFQRIVNGIFKTDFGVKYNLTKIGFNRAKYNISNVKLRDRNINVFNKVAVNVTDKETLANEMTKLMKNKLKTQATAQSKLTPEQAKQKFIEFSKRNCVGLDKLKMENDVNAFMREYNEDYSSEEAQYKLVKIRNEVSREMNILKTIMEAMDGMKKNDALYFHKYQVQASKLVSRLEEISAEINNMMNLSFASKK
ncbi:MAG: hypothetical protein LBH49_00395 [Puniceicoccales bacterium]|jgi:hypothetical protein|nr:hypothetical protein [Puniceicoccales bacterium]